MFYVTYRNVLRPGKTLDDYRRGLKNVWPTLQSWGASSMELFEKLYDESGAFYSRYTIESLDKWNANLQSPSFREMSKHLNDVLDLSKSEVEVAYALETRL